MSGLVKKKEFSDKMIYFASQFDNLKLLQNIETYWNDYLNRGILPKYEWVYDNIILNSDFSIIDEFQIFQYLSQEFVEELANKIKELKNKNICEICAGDGLLSYFLKNYGIKVYSSDSNKWKIPHIKDLNIEDYKLTLEKINPEIVIISWEEFQSAITEEVLKFDSVKYVIWIGEQIGGCCGDEDSLNSLNYEELKFKYNLCKTDSPHFDSHSRIYLFKK